MEPARSAIFASTGPSGAKMASSVLYPAFSSVASIRNWPQPPRVPASLLPFRSAAVLIGESLRTRMAWVRALERVPPTALISAPAA